MKSPPTSRRLLIGEMLTFLGPVVAIGGALTLLRTREPNLLYTAMMPIGLVAAVVGFWMRSKAER